MVIIPTHNELRSPNTLRYFINRFANGLGYSNRQKPCHICCVDGFYYLTDGHHETVAAYLTNSLDYSQYKVEYFTLGQMLEFNYPVWITPFNPHTECRLPNYWEYKESVLNAHSPVDEILQSNLTYKEERKVKNLLDLASKYIPMYLKG